MNTSQNTYKHPAPTYEIKLNTAGEAKETSKDITPQLNPLLIQLQLTECRSDEADMLDITLDDSQGLLEIPPKGVTLQLALGYKGEPLVHKGTFVVDEVSHSGPPDVLILRARSAELTHQLRARRSQSWHDTTVRSIVESIASRNHLTPRVDATLGSTVIGHMDQSSESDIAFITRLARHFDAVATVKNGTLIFLSINNTRTSQGEEIPTITIDRTQTTSHNFGSADRDSYTGVQATFEDLARASKNTVLVGTDDNIKILPEIYATKDEAHKAATAELGRIERSVAQLSLQLAKGVPHLMPQSVVEVTGFKNQINSLTWLAVKVTHTLNKGAGLMTSVELEVSSQKTEVENRKKVSGNTGENGFWR